LAVICARTFRFLASRLFVVISPDPISSRRKFESMCLVLRKE
jgi:hypothetical protein